MTMIESSVPSTWKVPNWRISGQAEALEEEDGDAEAGERCRELDRIGLVFVRPSGVTGR